MRPTHKIRSLRIAACLVHLAVLVLAGSATATLAISTATQSGTQPFTPTFIVATNTSLIAGLVPSTALGNFNVEYQGVTRSVNSLTLTTNLTVAVVGNQTASSNYVTCGNSSGAGYLIIYTLPSGPANGYDVTNITVYSGWINSGRVSQDYNVSYSTAANPTSFISLGYVNYRPAVSGPTVNQVMLYDSAGAPIAANVAALKFDFTAPVVPNGYSGYAAITVGGTASASVTTPPLVITTQNQNLPASTPPDWTIESDSLIAGQLPSAQGSGNFANEAGSAGLSALTDGTFGNVDANSSYATCGTNAGTSVTYTLTNFPYGTDLTNIVVYSGWRDYGRDGQFYNISYSTMCDPTTYIPLTSIFYNPVHATGDPNFTPANRVDISTSTGAPLARNVYNVRFDFTPQFASVDNGYSGYAEIILEGAGSIPPPPPPPILTQDTLPSFVETVVGDQVTFTAGFSNYSPATLQWMFISGGVTSPIPGATNSVLTLNNVQLTNSGSYLLEAGNTNNCTAAQGYSTAAPLVVGNVPAPVNNVIVEYAGQCGVLGSSANFHPDWTVNTNNDLIYGFPATGSGTPGTATGIGDFSGGGICNPDPSILEDGSFGFIGVGPGIGNLTEVVCGPTMGQSMIYYLITDSAPYGFDLTNITVYGGWADSGRNEQKYQVLYSTMANPTVFNVMANVDYNPNDPNNAPSATRTTLISSGVMARNVCCIKINWNLPGPPPKNGFDGYSEIVISGMPSPRTLPPAPITPVTAEDVQGSSLTIEANLSGPYYQWQKNGTNLPGATAATLTLANLQLTDTATNGGYRLVVSNGSDSVMTRECAVIVDPMPAPVKNLVTAFAYQTSDQIGFSPTWDTSALSSSLICGQNPPAGGYGPGNFNDPYNNANGTGMNEAGGLPVLTDGNYGYFTDDGSHPAFATGGGYAGQYVIYTLGANANGYDITNIQIASGWSDSGRDAQWYTVSYSTVANPTIFIPIAVVANDPAASDQSVVRTTITAANGLIASNAYALYVDFTTPPGVPNGYSGYSEISVFGSPVPSLPKLNPVRFSNGSLIVNGTGGTPNCSYTVLTTTNLPTALANWTVSVSGVTDGAGAFSNAIPVNASQPMSFFRLGLP